MSGATPSFTTRHSPFRSKNPPRGAVTNLPSMIGGTSHTPTSPPHVVVPTSGPIPLNRNMYGSRSPPEPAASLMIITFGPQMPAPGNVNALRSATGLLK